MKPLLRTAPHRRATACRARIFAFVGSISLIGAVSAHAQLDPEPRQLLHLGASQSLHNDGPEAHYLFYYWNKPNFPGTNQILRLVLAPTYVDGELGFRDVLGPNTDLGLGLFGGGFAFNYDEIRRGNYFRDESFDGHGGGANLSVYHLFNPGGKVPLNGLVRATMDYRAFEEGSDTANDFELPEDQPFVTLRAGLRWGGTEPVLLPSLGFEISAWYELEQRTDDADYGFAGDRQLEPTAHRFFGRAQLIYTLPRLEHTFAVGLMGGTVLNADRFSAFRVGGALPFTSEFPLYLPGYYHGELSTEDFGLLYGLYSIPFGSSKRWNVMAAAATALVDYIDGLDQSGEWHSGVGGGVGYTSKSRRWRVLATSAYGIDAIRSDGRGGYSAGMLFQYNFGPTTFASDRALQEMRRVRVPIR
jgi:hypothetical protein